MLSPGDEDIKSFAETGGQIDCFGTEGAGDGHMGAEDLSAGGTEQLKVYVLLFAAFEGGDEE